MVLVLVLLLTIMVAYTHGFHDCIQPKSGRRLPPNFGSAANLSSLPSCSGGLCVGMHNGPHEGGPASYPSGSVETGFTRVSSTMSVPELPEKMDGICYYIWTDIFFGDMSQGRMNQFVPQLILGNALDGSSGPPEYKPKWGTHTTWQFGAHYFFEIYNETTGQVESHAAYGHMYAAKAGEKVNSLECIKQELKRATSSPPKSSFLYILHMYAMPEYTCSSPKLLLVIAHLCNLANVPSDQQCKTMLV